MARAYEDQNDSLSKAIAYLGAVEVAHPRTGVNVLVAYYDASLGGWQVRNETTGHSHAMPAWWKPDCRTCLSSDPANPQRITADLATGAEIPC